MTLEIIPLQIGNEIKEKDKLAELIFSSISKKKIKDGDIFVVSQKIISKQEGRTVNLLSVIPSELAVGIASAYQKDPKLMEVILSETKRIIRMDNGIFIVETNHGFICANAGVDESNIEKDYATLLPLNSDQSADNLRRQIVEKTGKKVAVIISDTFGRAFRMGQTNCAIGISGINAIMDYEGTKDSFGKILRVTAIAIADELSAAAELVMGKTLKTPVAIVRNFKFHEISGLSKDLVRKENEDLFR